MSTFAIIKPHTTSVPSSNYPNEPNGYSVVFAHDFQAFPNGSNGEAGDDWLEDGGHSSNNTIVTDGTAPFGDTNVLRTRAPNGLAGGESYCNITVDQKDSGRKTSQYFCLNFMIEGTDYQNQATGTKFGFFSYGDTAAGAMNQSFLILVGTGATALQSAPNMELWQQGAIADRTLGSNLASSAIAVGSWHRLEMLMTTNTIGSSNGLFKMWVDGSQTHNYTNVVYRDSTYSLGLAGWKWQPYWGGVGGTRSRDDYFRLAHVYMSGI